MDIIFPFVLCGTIIYLLKDKIQELFIKIQIKDTWDRFCVNTNLAKEEKRKNEKIIINEFKIKKIKFHERGFSFCFYMPPGYKKEDITERQKEIETTFRGEVEIKYNCNSGLMTIYIYYLEEDFIFKIIEVKPYEVFFGYSAGKPVIVNLNQFPHIVLSGITGSGKNVLLNMILTLFIYHYSTKDVELYFTQLVKMELIEYRKYENTKDMAFTLKNAYEMFKKIHNIMVERTKEIFKYTEQYGIKNIVNYNEKFPNRKMSYIYVVIDEFAFFEIEKSDTDEEKAMKSFCKSIIKEILLDGRALGIFAIIIIQRPDTKILTGIAKAQIGNMITFKQNTKVASRVAIETNDAVFLEQRKAIYKGYDYWHIKVPYCTDEMIQGYLKHKEIQREPLNIDEILARRKIFTDDTKEKQDKQEKQDKKSNNKRNKDGIVKLS